MSSTVRHFDGLMYNGLNIAVHRIARYLLSCFASHVDIHPSILSALQSWVSLGLFNNQSPLLSIFHLLHPLLCLRYFQVCYNIIHPSQARCTFSSSYEQSSFHHLSRHCSHLHSLYMSQPSSSLSFYKFHNILSVNGSIQFFIISNSPSIPLLDWSIDLSSDVDIGIIFWRC